MSLSTKTKINIATVLTLLGFILGFMLSVYASAVCLGVGTMYVTVQEFKEDWSIATLDLICSVLMAAGGGLGGGVFGAVVGLGIGFGSSLFLPDMMREAFPWMSVKVRRERRETKRLLKEAAKAKEAT